MRLSSPSWKLVSPNISMAAMCPMHQTQRSNRISWKLINSCIIGTLGRNFVPSLAQELDKSMTAAEAWLLLKKRTQQDGIFAKLNTMHCALHIKFTHGMPMIDTLGELNNLIASIYEGGQAPT